MKRHTVSKEKGMEHHKGTWKNFPPMNLGRSFIRIAKRSQYFSRQNSEQVWEMNDGKKFTEFRYLRTKKLTESTGEETVFIVRFRFKRHSFNFNRWASLIPIPLIAGTSGFQEKMWSVDKSDGTWQGMYQFETAQAVMDYRHSLVFRIMNRRAVSESLEYTVLPGTILSEFLQNRSIMFNESRADSIKSL